MLTAEHLDVPLDFEGVGRRGSMLGTTALQIFDETTCVVRAVLRWTEFYAHESCGKCTPCREGTYWMVQILRRLEDGSGQRGRPRHAARHLRQHPRPVVLRPRRRRHQPDHRPRSSSSSDEYLAHQAHGGCPLDPMAATALRRSPRLMTVTASNSPERRSRAPADLVTPDHRRLRGQRAQGHADHPGRRAARHPDPAVLRPPAARPGRRLPAVPRRGRGPAQAGASCTTTVTDGMVVHTQLTSPVAEKAQRGIDGAAADQPPARLPGLRQGRRVPAAEPGDDQRPRPTPASTTSSGPTPSRSTISEPGPARPRALRAVRALHPVLRSRSPATRSSSCSSAARCSRSASTRTTPFDSYFSGNTIQICPVGALTGAAVPVPGPPVRPGLHARASASTARPAARMRTDHRRGKVTRRLAGDDPEVNEEWNCDKGRWAFQYATAGDRITRRWCATTTGDAACGQLARGAGRRRPRAGRGP